MDDLSLRNVKDKLSGDILYSFHVDTTTASSLIDHFLCHIRYMI